MLGACSLPIRLSQQVQDQKTQAYASLRAPWDEPTLSMLQRQPPPTQKQLWPSQNTQEQALPTGPRGVLSLPASAPAPQLPPPRLSPANEHAQGSQTLEGDTAWSEGPRLMTCSPEPGFTQHGHYEATGP